MTVRMTARELRDSGLLKNTRRIPFIDALILKIDEDLKWETRRPMKYLANGKRGKCAYGPAGILLLVTGSHVFLDGNGCLAAGKIHKGLTPLYRADWSGSPPLDVGDWRPPMYMPKWSPTRYLISRAVEPSRLCDITEEQALAEGVEEVSSGATKFMFPGTDILFDTAVGAFRHGWDSIHGCRGLYFDTNPEVWKIVVERLVIDV